KRLADAFGSRIFEFIRACEALGGVRNTESLHGKSSADASCDLPFLPNIIVRILLWTGSDADNDDISFPPQSQWLFSDNTPLAFSAEDVAVIGDMIINALKEIASRP
ncbi:MAG TPA: DUF3786 domain-containing protein, partial [Acidobacteriota bacterium]|nr:DUF3786 domain-containing protein [Acidobacteriota bacterium]